MWCAHVQCGTAGCVLLSVIEWSPFVFRLHHVCCCSYRNHLLSSDVKLGKVGEINRRNTAVSLQWWEWISGESCAVKYTKHKPLGPINLIVRFSSSWLQIVKALVVADIVGAASCTSTLKSMYWPSEEMDSPTDTSAETLVSS